MTSDKKIKCNNCGKELPKDSEFCQYCGSKNLVEYIEPKPIYSRSQKRCKNCGKELPKDSEFCQYCGSNEILIDYLGEDINEEKKAVSQNVLLIPLLIVSIIAACLGYGMYHNYKNYKLLEEEKNNEISNMNNTLSRARNEASTNRAKAENYDKVINYSNYSNGYSDFYARQTLLKKPNKQTVWIYFGYYNINVWSRPSSNAVKAEWGKGDGHWMPLTITYTGSGVEYVRLTNDKNNEEIYITIIGY